MKNSHLSQAKAAAVINSGAIAVFAGSEEALKGLPKGKWIGGTSPYFMTTAGGVVDPVGVFCTVVSEAVEARTMVLTKDTLPQVTANRFDNGFTYLMLPAFTAVHQIYSVDGPSYPGLYDQPVMGWVTGVHLQQLGKQTPKVFDGQTGRVYDDAALAMHVRLPAGLSAELDIINLFTQGSGPEILFPQGGFSATDCTVDGRPVNLAQYLTEIRADTTLPLVADVAGAFVNVSIQNVDTKQGSVAFYAPVIANESYRIARPVADDAGAYTAGSKGAVRPGSMLACNCILNFLYSDLQGRGAGGFVGPVTFGEIAYVMLNQTLVRLAIEDTAAPRQRTEAVAAV
jgi:hypothetical protein